MPQDIKRSRSASGGMSSKGTKNTTPYEKANEIIGYCLNKQIPLPLKNAFAVKKLWNEMTGKQMNNKRKHVQEYSNHPTMRKSRIKNVRTLRHPELNASK